jgi:heme exporter protein A
VGVLISETNGAPNLLGQRISIRRGNAWLFKSVTLELRARQVMWLRGANGCGKTTLLRLAVGLAHPDEGDFTWNGTPLRGNTEFAAKLVYVGHAHGLKDDLTALEALAFLGNLHSRITTEQKTLAALKRLAVHHRRHQTIKVLSQGQRKRIALARLALETAPGLWVLDEPYDALDSAGIAIVNTLLQENIERGGTVLMTSHIPVVLGTTLVTELDLEQASNP